MPDLSMLEILSCPRRRSTLPCFPKSGFASVKRFVKLLSRFCNRSLEGVSPVMEVRSTAVRLKGCSDGNSADFVITHTLASLVVA